MTEEKIVLDVEGMSCQHCVNSVKRAVGPLTGVHGVEVDLAGKKVVVTVEQGEASVSQIKEAIEEEGYEVK